MNASQFILSGLMEPAFSSALFAFIGDEACVRLRLPQVSSPFALGADMAGFMQSDFMD